MHHYYIPCTQQERLHSSTKRPQTSFRQSALSNRKIDQSNQQWRASQYDSQTPSLEDSSSPSQQDETSPRTPGSFTNDDICTVEPAKSQNTVDESAHYGGYDFLNGDVLPSRPKNANQPHVERASVPAVITETAIRSRVARPTSNLDVGIPMSKHGLLGKVPTTVSSNSKCHSRRRPCGQSAAIAPPKLKRDTDCTDAIVRLIVCFSTKLVHAIWSESSSTPRSSNAFPGAAVLPLRVFIQETLRRSKTSYSTLQVALFYLILLKPYVGQHHSQEGRPSGCRALQCGRRMFLTALILASKYLQDRNYSSRAWSKISGLPINEINDNERRYLGLIQFNLHMKKDTFDNWSKIVLTLCKTGEHSMNQDLAQESSRSRNIEISDNASITSDDEARSGSDQWWTQQFSLLSSDLIESSEQTEIYLASLNRNKSDTTIGSEELLASLDTPPSSPDSASDLVTEKSLSKPSQVNMEFSGQKFADFSSSPATISKIPTQPRIPNLPTPQTTPRFPRTLPMPKGMCQMRSRCKESSRALLGLDRHAVSIANLETCPPPQPRARECPGSNLANNAFISGFASSPESMVSDVTSSAPRSRSSSMSSNSSTWWSAANQQWVDEASARVPGMRKENQPMSSRQHLEAPVPTSYSFYHNTTSTSQYLPTGRDACAEPNMESSSSMSISAPQGAGYGNDVDDIDAILASLTTDRNVPSVAKCPAVTAAADSHRSAEQASARKHKRNISSVSEDVLQYRVRNLIWDEPSAVEVIDSSKSDRSQEKQLQIPAKEWAGLKKPVPNGVHTKRFAMCHEVDSYPTELASQYLRADITMVG